MVITSTILGTGVGQAIMNFVAPTAVAIDNANNIYVADQYNQRLMIYDSNLVYIGRIWRNPGAELRQ